MENLHKACSSEQYVCQVHLEMIIVAVESVLPNATLSLKP
jgi:hypothetical protein